MEEEDTGGEFVEEENEKEEKEKQIKAGCHYHIAKIAEDEAQRLKTTASRQTVAALTEVFFEHAKTIAQDLEAFAKHAKRSTVQPEDVRMCVRRNEGLHNQITKKMEELAAVAEERKASKRKPKTGKKQTETDEGVALKPKRRRVEPKKEEQVSTSTVDIDADENENQ